MAKRRTRKQKLKAKHIFRFTEATVKRQINKEELEANHQGKLPELARELTKDEFSASSKRDIVKSLSLASVILCLELVLYLFWQK